MKLRIRVPLRHPFFSNWVASPARLTRGRCAALSGSFAELAQAAASGIQAERAVLALQYPDSPFMSQYERNVLWQIFQVPIFSMLLDGDGRLIAWECEAQDGLHIASRGAGIDGLIYRKDDSVLGYRIPWGEVRLESAPCECGRPGMRLVPPPMQRAMEPERNAMTMAGDRIL